MAQSLFTVQTPASGDNSDGTPGITTATAVRFAVDGEVTGIRFYATATVGGTYTGLFYAVTAGDRDPGPGTGTLLESKVLGVAPTGGTWNTITFDEAVPVTAGLLYKAALFSGDGRYVNTNNFFTVDLVNGDITADADGDDPAALGTLTQGSFQIDSIPNYPRTSGTKASYLVDVLFEPDVETASGTVAAVLPALTAAAAGTASAAGTLAAALPALTAAAAGTASASGTVAVTLPALTAAVTGAMDLPETSSPTPALATASRSPSLVTTTRDRVIASGTSPGGA